MDYTPEQIEWAARLLCVAEGEDPEAWPHVIKRSEPDRLLAELERQRVKVLGPIMPPCHLQNQDWLPACKAAWRKAHDAAPICPDAGEGE